jgi:polygalacturonase
MATLRYSVPYKRLLPAGFLALIAVFAPWNAAAAGTNRAIFNIVDYGARNDASAPATDAFQRAIAALHRAGGGIIYVPPGKYTTGPIAFVSNMTLEIDAGAVVEFPATMLPFTKGRQQGVETLTPVPLIGGHDLENVTITGRGILTSNNADWVKLHGRIAPSASDPGSADGPHWEHLLQALEANQPISDQEYRDAASELRPSFVRFMNSKNILVEGVRFAGSPMWTIHLLYSENAVVQNVTIETYPGVHTDGIVVDSSRFVRISNCYVDAGDDGIVIKSGKDADGLRVNRPSEYIAITNCTVHHAHGAVTIGSETSGSVRHVVASNITVLDTENGIRIKSRRGRGGVVEDIRFDNWTMQNPGVAIVVTSYYMMEGETQSPDETVSRRTPTLRDIAISHVTVSGAKQLIDIEGLPEMPVSGLRLTDIVGSGETGLLAQKTDALELHQVQLNVEHGPAFLIEDSANLELDDVSSRTPQAEAPVIRLTHSSNAVMRNSRAFPGTNVFLSALPGELQQLRLKGNNLEDARTPTQELAQ